MSQQEMGSEELPSHEPSTFYRSYRGAFSQDESFSDFDRQKLSPRSKRKNSLIASRIFLAITSLFLWLVAFLFVIVVMSLQY